jgi:hypothetical protein
MTTTIYNNYYYYYYFLLNFITPILTSFPAWLWLYTFVFHPSYHQQAIEYQRKLVHQCLTYFIPNFSTTTNTTTPTTTKPHHRRESSDDLTTNKFTEFADQTWHEAHGAILGPGSVMVVIITSSLSWIVEGRSSIAKMIPMFIFPFSILYFAVIRKKDIHNSQQQQQPTHTTTTTPTTLTPLRKIHFTFVLMNAVSDTTIVLMQNHLLEKNVSMTPDMLKRNIFSTTFVCLFMFESLIDTFAVLYGTTGMAVVGSIMHGHLQHIFPTIFQGIWLMMIIILVTLTSMRGRMNSIIMKLIKSPRYRESSIKFSVIALSSLFLFSAMYATTIEPIHFKTMIKDISTSLFCGLGLLIWKVAPLIDGGPTTLSPRSLRGRQLHVFFADSLLSIFHLVIVLIFHLITIQYYDVIVNALPEQWTKIDSNMMFVIVMLLPLILFIGTQLGTGSPALLPSSTATSSSPSTATSITSSSYRYHEKVVKFTGLLVGIIQFLIIVTSPIPDVTVLTLSVIRILMLGIGRSLLFFDSCVVTIGLSLASVFVTNSPLVVLNCLGLSIIHLLMTLETSLTRKSIMVMIQTNVEAQGFVEHALKQKFVGCLNAVEDILKHNNEELSEEQRILLKRVARTCAFGLDQTYYYTLQRRYGRFGDIGGQSQQATLDQVVEEWRMGWADEVEWIKASGNDNESSHLIISKRWDLVRLVLHKLMGQNLTNLMVTYSVQKQLGSNIISGLASSTSSSSSTSSVVAAKINFEIARKGRKPGTRSKFKTITGGGLDPFVANEMNATCSLQNGGFEICLSFELTKLNLISDNSYSTTLTTPQSTRKNSAVATPPSNNNNNNKQSNNSNNTTFPPHLVFAVLDDVKLVRINVLRYLIEELDAHQASFALGQTKEEALVDFVEKCLHTHVDVALIDVHLEYDDGLQYGTEVALVLRKRDFKGTIMLHSANEQNISVQNNNLESIIDGFLEKRAFQKQYVVNSILKAMEKRKKMDG